MNFPIPPPCIDRIAAAEAALQAAEIAEAEASEAAQAAMEQHHAAQVALTLAHRAVEDARNADRQHHAAVALAAEAAEKGWILVASGDQIGAVVGKQRVRRDGLILSEGRRCWAIFARRDDGWVVLGGGRRIWQECAYLGRGEFGGG